MKKIYRIPVEWSVSDIVEVEAESLELAVKYVEDNIDDIPLGANEEYIDGSYRINGSDDYDGEELINYIKEFYN